MNNLLKIASLLVGLLWIYSCDKYDVTTTQSDTFVKYYNANNLSKGDDVIETDEGFFVLGHHNTETKGTDILAFEIDQFGNTINNITSFGNRGDDIAYKMIKASDGNFVICGSTRTTLDGIKQAFVTKLSSTASQLWTYTLPTTIASEFLDVIDVNGSYYVVGYNTASNGAKSAIYACISTSGELDWLKKNNDVRSNKITSVTYNSSDESFRVIGEIENNNQTDLYYFRFNAIGSLSRTIDFPTPTTSETAYKIVNFQNKDVVLSSTTIGDYKTPHLSLYNDNLQTEWEADYNISQTVNITDFEIDGENFLLLTNSLFNSTGQIKVTTGKIESKNSATTSFGDQSRLEGQRILRQNESYIILGSNIQLSNASSILILKMDAKFNF